MSEYLKTETEPALPGMEFKELIKDMSYHERMEHKAELLDGISDRERLCRIIDDVNFEEGQYVDMDEEWL